MKKRKRLLDAIKRTGQPFCAALCRSVKPQPFCDLPGLFGGLGSEPIGSAVCFDAEKHGCGGVKAEFRRTLPRNGEIALEVMGQPHAEDTRAFGQRIPKGIRPTGWLWMPDTAVQIPAHKGSSTKRR